MQIFVWRWGYENVASALHYCWRALRVPSFTVAAQYAYKDLFTFDSMSWGSFPDVFRLFSTTRCPEDTATVYVRRPRRGCTQPKFVICANASLRYVFRGSGIWVKVCSAFTWLKARVLSRGRYLYYHTLLVIDGWTEGCFVWCATKSNEGCTLCIRISSHAAGASSSCVGCFRDRIY